MPPSGGDTARQESDRVRAECEQQRLYGLGPGQQQCAHCLQAALWRCVGCQDELYCEECFQFEHEHAPDHSRVFLNPKPASKPNTPTHA